ncbi:hypothetical protein HETIRDRAFT_430140 [Heterobasidion irregulare TC 32-1]|uniref:Uncharacterized protein n=1 Tax=Heterobasidion irregulare (strain TC 32-1) TaxID=747525 RepID=W4JTK1_HETIT|nr:uncharacterized protein HETIRDRAFT_430140 [Heterobasidion irregulare TC 32-1]ETW76858.1 hypothetical protein HETIRDRAFT_430140 [Heterobasidion irregulare TC 32-1]
MLRDWMIGTRPPPSPLSSWRRATPHSIDMIRVVQKRASTVTSRSESWRRRAPPQRVNEAKRIKAPRRAALDRSIRAHRRARRASGDGGGGGDGGGDGDGGESVFACWWRVKQAASASSALRARRLRVQRHSAPMRRGAPDSSTRRLATQGLGARRRACVRACGQDGSDSRFAIRDSWVELCGDGAGRASPATRTAHTAHPTNGREPRAAGREPRAALRWGKHRAGTEPGGSEEGKRELRSHGASLFLRAGVSVALAAWAVDGRCGGLEACGPGSLEAKLPLTPGRMGYWGRAVCHPDDTAWAWAK